MFVNLYTGEAQPCYQQPFNQNIFEDLSRPIRFDPVGHFCSQPYCINSHAHLTWGLIPGLDTPTYDQMRNRKMVNGEEWLSDDCKQFFKTRLYESNVEFSPFRRALYTITYPARMIVWYCADGKTNMARVRKYIKRKIRWKKDGAGTDRLLGRKGVN